MKPSHPCVLLNPRGPDLIDNVQLGPNGRALDKSSILERERGSILAEKFSDSQNTGALFYLSSNCKIFPSERKVLRWDAVLLPLILKLFEPLTESDSGGFCHCYRQERVSRQLVVGRPKSRFRLSFQSNLGMGLHINSPLDLPAILLH